MDILGDRLLARGGNMYARMWGCIMKFSARLMLDLA